MQYKISGVQVTTVTKQRWIVARTFTRASLGLPCAGNVLSRAYVKITRWRGRERHSQRLLVAARKCEDAELEEEVELNIIAAIEALPAVDTVLNKYPLTQQQDEICQEIKTNQKILHKKGWPSHRLKGEIAKHQQFSSEFSMQVE